MQPNHHLFNDFLVTVPDKLLDNLKINKHKITSDYKYNNLHFQMNLTYGENFDLNRCSSFSDIKVFLRIDKDILHLHYHANEKKKGIHLQVNYSKEDKETLSELIDFDSEISIKSFLMNHLHYFNLFDTFKINS